MKRYFCKGKKDFCNDIEACSECKFVDGSGVISEVEVNEMLCSLLNGEIGLDRLRELVEADIVGRCIVLPKDEMLYHLEEAIDGSEKWISNKPIVDVYFKVGWGIATLAYSIFDIGKKVFFDRKSAEIALKELLKGE